MRMTQKTEPQVRGLASQLRRPNNPQYRDRHLKADSSMLKLLSKGLIALRVCL